MAHGFSAIYSGPAGHYWQNAYTHSKPCTIWPRNVTANPDANPSVTSELICALLIGNQHGFKSRADNPLSQALSIIGRTGAASDLLVISCGTSIAHLSLIPQAGHCKLGCGGGSGQAASESTH